MMQNTTTQIIKLAKCFAVLTLVVLSACQPTPEKSSETTIEKIPEHLSEQPPAEIQIGYCPTMASHVQALVADHPYLVPRGFNNSAMAMGTLHAGQVQAILIGRRAWE